MTRNIYGDRVDPLGRPEDSGDASPIDGRTAAEALRESQDPWGVLDTAPAEYVPVDRIDRTPPEYRADLVAEIMATHRTIVWDTPTGPRPAVLTEAEVRSFVSHGKGERLLARLRSTNPEENR